MVRYCLLFSAWAHWNFVKSMALLLSPYSKPVTLERVLLKLAGAGGLILSLRENSDHVAMTDISTTY